jgi:uroporphyrinogen decarboxylase
VFGEPDEVRRSVGETIAAAGPGGGYIISSSNSIHPGCKPENYLAMVEAAREYGKYPLAAQ